MLGDDDLLHSDEAVRRLQRKLTASGHELPLLIRLPLFIVSISSRFISSSCASIRHKQYDMSVSDPWPDKVLRPDVCGSQESLPEVGIETSP